MPSIDLNGDVGEGSDDAAFLACLTSANIACGGHAGDEATMRRTLSDSSRLCVAAGAHPGIDDRGGFGRLPARLSPRETRELVVSQVSHLGRLARELGVRLGHVKPHGGLYSLAMRDAAVWAAVVEGVAAVDSRLVLVGLAGPGSEARGVAAAERGIRTVRELFADRGYQPDGGLVPRGEPGAVIEEPAAVEARLRNWLREGWIETPDGARIPLEADTICLHGDNPAAVTLARMVRAVLTEEGVRAAPFAP